MATAKLSNSKTSFSPNPTNDTPEEVDSIDDAQPLYNETVKGVIWYILSSCQPIFLFLSTFLHGPCIENIHNHEMEI